MCYLDVAKYIINKVNNQLSFETLKQGITSVYKKTFVADDQTIEAMVNDTLQYNKGRQELVFPIAKK